MINTNLASGVPFVSPHDVTGLTVPPADIAALGSAITRLMNDAVFRGRLGRAARERADLIFRPQAMAARTLPSLRTGAWCQKTQRTQAQSESG